MKLLRHIILLILFFIGTSTIANAQEVVKISGAVIDADNQPIELALVRIKNKTYGICKTTGKLIPRERLLRVPHATECIEAKTARK